MRIYKYIISALVTCSCTISDNFETPKETCSDIKANKSLQEVFNIANTKVTKYTDDDHIEVYVTSNDQGGNFFKTISMQTFDGSLGLSVPIDQTDLYTIYRHKTPIYS